MDLCLQVCLFAPVDLAQIAQELSRSLASLSFGAPITHVYNPLEYAWAPHAAYLARYGRGPKEVVFVGMNPGPWGMAQTGVPFGEVSLVRDWLGIEAPVEKPAREHPARPIVGFACQRSEVSGARLWGFFRQRCTTPERFFARAMVLNYCPLVFMEESGRNFTPDKLPEEERRPLFERCDRALSRMLGLLAPRVVVGVGQFAEARAKLILGTGGPRVGRVLHPSPASPAANKDWGKSAAQSLAELGVEL